MVGCTLMTHGLDRDLHPTARVEAALREGEGGYAECGTMRSEPVWIAKLTMEKQYTDLKSALPRGYLSKGTQLEENKKTSGFAGIHVSSSVRSFASSSNSSKRKIITSNIRIQIGLLRLSDLSLRPHAREIHSLKIRAGLDSWSS